LEPLDKTKNKIMEKLIDSTARFEPEHKALHLMRYFNKAVQNNSLISYEKKNTVSL
jgi:hypothetical protein